MHECAGGSIMSPGSVGTQTEAEGVPAARKATEDKGAAIQGICGVSFGRGKQRPYDGFVMGDIIGGSKVGWR